MCSKTDTFFFFVIYFIFQRNDKDYDNIITIRNCREDKIVDYRLDNDSTMKINLLCGVHTYPDSTQIKIVVLIMDLSALSYQILSKLIRPWNQS